jgi:delta 1-pyrroline-5-carboxylate dehydrogenase
MTGAVAFAALMVAAALAGRYGRPAAVLLAVVAVGSLFVNRSMEGRVLYTVPGGGSHGLSAGDLVSFTGFVLAVILFVFPRRA